MSKSSATRKTVSQKQLDANRANAARSTGPRTTQGKTRSSQNARKFHFSGTDFPVVRLEDIHDVDNLVADAVAVYRPINSQERFAVERIALAQHALLRAIRFETGFFTSCMDHALNRCVEVPFLPLGADMVGGGDIDITRAQNRNYALAEGFLKISRKSDGWQFVLRNQVREERLYRRAIEDFERLRALRPRIEEEESRNEPIFEPQLQETEVIFYQKKQTQTEPEKPSEPDPGAESPASSEPQPPEPASGNAVESATPPAPLNPTGPAAGAPADPAEPGAPAPLPGSVAASQPHPRRPIQTNRQPLRAAGLPELAHIRASALQPQLHRSIQPAAQSTVRQTATTSRRISMFRNTSPPCRSGTW